LSTIIETKTARISNVESKCRSCNRTFECLWVKSGAYVFDEAIKKVLKQRRGREHVLILVTKCRWYR